MSMHVAPVANDTTAPFAGSSTVTSTQTTERQITAKNCHRLVVQNATTSTATIAVGPTGSVYMELLPGVAMEFFVPNTGQIWYKALTAANFVVNWYWEV